MILFDEAADQRAIALDAFSTSTELEGDDGPDQRRSEDREVVEAWLDAVALCFGLPEGRRWIDPERLYRRPEGQRKR